MARIGLLILPLMACGVISAISLIAFSHFVERDNPALALKLFPLNVEALLNMAEKRFAGEVSNSDLAEIDGRARRMLSFDPGEARLYSLIGEVKRRRGSDEEAFAAFNRALSLSRTELHALQWTITHENQSGDALGLIDEIDALFRRWPDRVGEYAPLVPGFLAAPASYDNLLGRLEDTPPWRSTLISRLAANATTRWLSARLVQDLAAGPSPPKSGEISNVVNGLLNGNQPDEAYQTFILTLSSEQRQSMGYVFDGRFRLSSAGIPFDWQIRDHPGVVFSYPGAKPDSTKAGIKLDFQQAPVRNLRLRQYLHLPVGRYTLSMNAAAAAAVLPEGLAWTIRCVGSNAVLAELPVTGGTHEGTALKVDMAVTPGRCPIQTLYLSTNAVADNWNKLYRGSVTFDDVKIMEKLP